MSLRPTIIRFLVVTTVLSGVLIAASWALWWPLVGLGALAAVVAAAFVAMSGFVRVSGRTPTGAEQRRLGSVFAVIVLLVDLVPAVICSRVAPSGAGTTISDPVIVYGVGSVVACQLIWVVIAVYVFGEIVRRPARSEGS